MKCPICGRNNDDTAINCTCGQRLIPKMEPLYGSFSESRITNLMFGVVRIFQVNWRTFAILGFISAILSHIDDIVKIPQAKGSYIALYCLLGLVLFGLSAFTSLAIIFAADKACERVAASVKQSYASAFHLPSFFRYCWAFILNFSIGLAGFIPFLVPACIWGISYSMAPLAVVIEKMDNRQALSYSAGLTHNGKLKLLLSLIVGCLCLILLISLPLSILDWLVSSIFHQSVPGFSSWPLDLNNIPAQPSPLWSKILDATGEIVTWPLFLIFAVMLFKACQIDHIKRGHEPDRTSEDNKPMRIWVLIIALGFLAGTIGAFQLSRNSVATADATSGVIVDLIEKKTDKGKAIYAPKVRFKTRMGYVVEFVSSTSYDSKDYYHRGEDVTVLYDPTAPRKAEIKSFFNQWGFTSILAVISMILIPCAQYLNPGFGKFSQQSKTPS